LKNENIPYSIATVCDERWTGVGFTVSQFMCQSTDRSDSDLRDCDTGVEELDHICVPAAAYAWEGGGGTLQEARIILQHHP